MNTDRKPEDITVGLFYNEDGDGWQQVAILSLTKARECVARSTKPEALCIIDAETNRRYF